MNKYDDEESPMKEDLEPLIETLKYETDWNKRFGAASKLFRLGKEKAIDPLISALQNDDHPEVRRFSAKLLGQLGDSRATWALLAALRKAITEKDSTMIYQTQESLLNIGGYDLVSILISTVTDAEENFSVRLIAVEMLGTIGNNQAVQGLISIIKNPDTEGKIRGKAIEELIYTGNLAGLQLILDQLEATKRKKFQKLVINAIAKTPFKNKTIVFRIGEILLSISEKEQLKGLKKDEALLSLINNTLKFLAKNIEYDYKKFMDELIIIRNKQKEK